MRVLLIRPPYTDFEGTEPPQVGIPIGTLSVAAALEQAGHHVEILDALTYTDKAEKGHFGASWQRIMAEIKAFSPDVVGITNLFSTQLEKSLRLPRMIKEYDPRIKTIVGGPHATVRPQDFLSAGVDFVVIGEGEETAPALLEYLEGRNEITNVHGIAYMENGRLCMQPAEYIKDMDKMSLPAYRLVDMEMYFTMVFRGFSSRPQDPFFKPRREISMITSRGCPYTCTFCSIHPTMGYRFRAHSPAYVINHIEHVITKYGVEFIHFEDDNLILDQKRFEEILDGLSAKGLRFEWDTPNGVRADTLPRRLLEKIKKSGISELRIAVESGVQGVLDSIVKKSLDLGVVEQVARDCHELKIPLAAFYVIGMPGETKQDIQKTLDLAFRMMERYSVTPHVNIANPLIGTELYETARNNGYLIEETYAQGPIFGAGRIKTGEFTPGELKEMKTEFYKKFRRHYIMKMLKSPKKLAGKIKMLVCYPRSTIRLLRLASMYTR